MTSTSNFLDLFQYVQEDNTWPHILKSKYAPRDDIFSRFSIPHKNDKKEFDQLFSTVEGNYSVTTNTIYNHFSPTRNSHTKTISSLQDGYHGSDLTRFTAQALDKSLKGRSPNRTSSQTSEQSARRDSALETFVNSKDGTGFELERLRADIAPTPTEQVNAFIW